MIYIDFCSLLKAIFLIKSTEWVTKAEMVRIRPAFNLSRYNKNRGDHSSFPFRNSSKQTNEIYLHCAVRKTISSFLHRGGL